MSDLPVDDYQRRVGEWCVDTFGEDIAHNRKERALRILEEAMELAQVEDLPMPQIFNLALRVWSRPKGDPGQEVAGIGVTLLAYCAAADIDFEKELELEILRIERPEVQEVIRRKQHEKRLAGVSATKEGE